VYGLHALPDLVSFEQGALLEPLAVGMAVLRRAHLHVGDTLTIIGDGPVGLNTLIVARAAGARRVIVVGEQEARLACAEKLGALACDHRQGAIPTAVFRHHGRSQIVVEATGTAIGVQMALSVVAPEGRVVLAGYAHGRPVTIPADAVHLPNVQIVGAGNNPGWMGRTLACVADGVLASTQLVSHRYRLDQYAEALEQMRSRGNGLIKSLFTWEDF
ncbi:MAG: zinc-binding dehydrogenase, partial [Thermaerobacter sp.]|nr:zinc-binding dehydrogenase [Thermaerobacter sp.]